MGSPLFPQFAPQCPRDLLLCAAQAAPSFLLFISHTVIFFFSRLNKLGRVFVLLSNSWSLMGLSFFFTEVVWKLSRVELKVLVFIAVRACSGSFLQGSADWGQRWALSGDTFLPFHRTGMMRMMRGEIRRCHATLCCVSKASVTYSSVRDMLHLRSCRAYRADLWTMHLRVH